MSNDKPAQSRERGSKEALIEALRKAAASNEGRVHVLPLAGKWAVKREGKTRAALVKATKGEAVEAASKMKAATRVVIHERDGSFHSGEPLLRA